MLVHPGPQLVLDASAMCSGPCRRTAEVDHGDVGADHERLDDVGAGVHAGRGGQRHVGAELGPQDGDPPQRQAQLPRLAELDAGHDVERVEVEVGLVEAVEQHQSVGAGVDDRAAAKLAIDE